VELIPADAELMRPRWNSMRASWKLMRADGSSVGAPLGLRNGAEGNRTPDLFAASEALCQLSYSPEPVPLRPF
jgi:hypothetical protein